ncbi:MAG TPA: hypothetical protein VGN69_00200 [Solirubrobacteraceae bacterium]|nr:hypothetical protein [Solirubrobacteraceae bacterium]
MSDRADQPFDAALPSPIAPVLSLGAQAEGSVVTVAGMSVLQSGTYIPGHTEREIVKLAQQRDAPDLIVISGSAGGGKSALIASVLSDHSDLFDDDVVYDATHAERPDVTQADRLGKFFAPFADGASAWDAGGLPKLIAANTGMLIQLFQQFRDEGAAFTQLEALLKHKLGVTRAEEEPVTPWSIVVVNLDLRPTAGQDGLARDMIAALDFNNPDGLLEGAPRCGTCRVRAFCPVRTNSLMLAASVDAADAVLEAAALRRGRHDPPRVMWDFLSRALTGDDTFDAHPDPCVRVAEAASQEDQAWVWEHMLMRKFFGLGGELGRRVADLDPSLRPSMTAHELLANAGVRPEGDAAAVASAPGGGEALETAAILAGSRSLHVGELGRALVTAAFLGDARRWEFMDADDVAFGALIAEYGEQAIDPDGQFTELWQLPALLEDAIAQAFGVRQGGAYIPVEGYDPRQSSRVFVRLHLSEESRSYVLVEDPAERRDPLGADLAGHRPLAVTVKLGGVEVAINLPTFRLLRVAAAGTVASTADVERFYALRRAVEALARMAAGPEEPLLIEAPGSGQRYEISRAAAGGRSLLVLREP